MLEALNLKNNAETRYRCQVSVYRTIGPLVVFKYTNTLEKGSIFLVGHIPLPDVHKIRIICPLLAHLSQRLIGELIGYSWSGVRPSVVRRRRRRTSSSTISNIFFSETAGPIKAKFYLEPPWVGGTIFCSRHLGHMTKMAATPIYGKNPSKIFFSRTGRPISTKLGM